MYRSIVRTSVVREMEFRTNFWAGISQQLLWAGIYIAIVEAVFNQTDTLAGWNRGEVFVILALSRVIEGLMHILFIRNIGEIPSQINEGTFDYTLVRPLPAQLYSAFQHFLLYNIGSFVAGLVLLSYALLQPGIELSLGGIASFLVLMILGMVVFYSILIIAAALGFFLERLEAIWAFFHLFSEPLTVPFDIFPQGPRIAFTYLLPLALVVFVPAQALVGRLRWWQLPVALLITGIFLVISNIVWRAGLRRYTSASS